VINHARTLLLNRDGDKRPSPDFFGEEVVPLDFRAIELPQFLINTRRALFGSNPDDAGMNYALWRYMRILHSTEYADWVTALDDRITYLHDRALFDETFGVSIAADDDALDFVGDPGLGGADGKLMTTWIIDWAHPAVTIANAQSGNQFTYYPTFADGISTLMPMTDYDDYQVRIRSSLADLSAWTVSYLGRPTISMDPVSRASQLLSLGDETYTSLFPAREPYILFKKLWERHPHFPYKMSGALLATIYRTEEIRTGA
jgi:hypothetical protein